MLIIRCLLSFLLVILCTLPSRPQANLPWDGDARMPIQRCMNLGGALESPRREGEWGYTIRREDLQQLKNDGFDTVRLPIRWSAHMGMNAPYAIDQPFLDRVDEIVQWAGQIGLNIILNVHHYDLLNVRPNIHEKRLEALWDQLAYHYATAPDFVIFETLNEPHSAMTVRRTDTLNRRLLKRIRIDNPERWVILATADWGSLDGLKKSRPVYDKRAILTYHDYSPFEFTHQGAPWADPPKPMGVDWGSAEDIADVTAETASAKAVAERYRMPLFVGEFGVYEKVPLVQRAAWVKARREAYEAHNMAWCHWDFATTLKAYDADKQAWLPEMKAALLGPSDPTDMTNTKE